MQLLIPAAGAGSRFAAAGYTVPKPLIEFHGKPMLAHVLDNMSWLRPSRTVILTRQFMDGFDSVVQKHVDGLTEGAACTAMLAEDILSPDEPLVIANSDQLVDFDVSAALQLMPLFDGGVFCFDSPDRNPKWSYVDVDPQTGVIHRVVEKRAVSSRATCGIYYFRRADLFFRAARAMIAMQDRTNGEFYIAPTLNYLVASGKDVIDIPVREMHGLGTPEDLEQYLRRFLAADV